MGLNFFKKETKIDIKIIKNKNLLFRISLYIICLYLLAVTFNLFLKPTNLISGGSNGIVLIANKIFSIDVGVLVSISYIIFLILNFIFMDLESTAFLLLTTILYPLFINITSNITDIISINYDSMLLICVFSGVINGVLIGFIIKIGFSPGGLIVISNILYKKFKISISKSNFIMTVIIVIIGGYFFGVNSILYAIIVMYIITIFTDKILLGISKNKLYYIITEKENEIKTFINTNLTHGVTLINCHTGYKNQKKRAIMCVIPTKQYFILKEGIKKIDPEAFLVITDAYEVLGGI